MLVPMAPSKGTICMVGNERTQLFQNLRPVWIECRLHFFRRQSEEATKFATRRPDDLDFSGERQKVVLIKDTLASDTYQTQHDPWSLKQRLQGAYFFQRADPYVRILAKSGNSGIASSKKKFLSLVRLIVMLRQRLKIAHDPFEAHLILRPHQSKSTEKSWREAF